MSDKHNLSSVSLPCATDDNEIDEGGHYKERGIDVKCQSARFMAGRDRFNGNNRLSHGGVAHQHDQTNRYRR